MPSGGNVPGAPATGIPHPPPALKAGSSWAAPLIVYHSLFVTGMRAVFLILWAKRPLRSRNGKQPEVIPAGPPKPKPLVIPRFLRSTGAGFPLMNEMQSRSVRQIINKCRHKRPVVCPSHARISEARPSFRAAHGAQRSKRWYQTVGQASCLPTRGRQDACPTVGYPSNRCRRPLAPLRCVRSSERRTRLGPIE
jgi:hypothetical protein